MATPMGDHHQGVPQATWRKEFSTLKDYETDFIGFLRSKNFYTNARCKYAYLENFAWDYNSWINWVVEKNRGLLDNPSETKVNRNFWELIGREVWILWLLFGNQNQECLREFEDYTSNVYDLFQRTNWSHYQDRFPRKMGINAFPGSQILGKWNCLSIIF